MTGKYEILEGEAGLNKLIAYVPSFGINFTIKEYKGDIYELFDSEGNSHGKFDLFTEAVNCANVLIKTLKNRHDIKGHDQTP